MITIPTLSELRTQVQADLEASFGSTIPAFGKNFLRILTEVQAAKLWLIYKALGFLQKNIFVDTADPEASGGTLERFGRIKLNRNPFAAIAGQYVVEVIGTIGAIIPAKTTFKSADDSASPGKMFILDTQFQLTSSPDEITLRALEAGLESQLNVDDELQSTVPVANVNKVVTVVSEAVEPLAAEGIEEYRSKVIIAFQLEPQGGAATDYRIWAADAQGVERVYPYAKSNATNEVNLYVEATALNSVYGDGVPSPTLLSDVQDVVEFDPDTTKPVTDRGRKPITVVVHYLPITVKDIHINISGFIGITAAIQANILAALTLLISEIRPFVSAADIIENKNDILDVNRIISTILTAQPGSVFGAVTLEVNGSPVTTFTFVDGNIPFLDSVTYV